MAEEVVLYPALALCGGKLVAGQAYAEQTAAKLQLGGWSAPGQWSFRPIE